jgi:hypothetical protein
MLTRVDIINSRNNTLSLTLMDSSNGYIVKEIDGLGPVNATLTTSSLAQVDGAQPQNARRDIRNILIKLGPDPDFLLTTVQSLRSNLYDWFMPKANVGLKFYLDNVLFVTTTGQVETFDNPMFTADPEIDISIVCYNPDFQAPADVVLTSDTVSTTDTQTISYPGTSDAGVIFTLNIDRSLDGVTLYNTTPDNTVQQFALSGTGAFIAGDVLVINTIPGQKGVTLTRGGISSSVMFYVDDSVTWITLQKGDNQFRAFASGAAIPYTLTHTPLYGAI